MQPIQFYHRDKDRIESEQIYGEKWLRWAYETQVGRLGLEAFVKRAWFSHWYGRQMDSPKTRSKIADFIETYGLDPAEFADPESFSSFNEFFRRKLNPEARPIDALEKSVVFPADGRHLAIPDLSKATGFYAKGQEFDLESFLGDRSLSEKYRSGGAVFSRLCPVDYHRFHFGLSGVPEAPQLLNGPLYSVSPIALRRSLVYLLQNKRVMTRVQSEKFGQVLVIEIGATNVGSIRQSFNPDVAVSKGDEKGWFEFGGSMVAMFFEPERVEFSDDLVAHSAENREVYAKMGDAMGEGF
ncbi:MAG: archaetidylserine decarboxylase [Verrucomicrobiota bacterium]